MVEHKFLQSEGRSRGTIYFIQGTKPLTPDDVFGVSSEHLGTNSEHLPTSSEHLPTNSEPLGQKVDGLAKPIIFDIERLDETQQQVLQHMAAQVSNSGKIKQAQLTSAIITICENHYLSLKALSQLLGRSSDYLRQHYLNPMVKAGQLQRAFPTKPNDPRQAYISISSKE